MKPKYKKGDVIIIAGYYGRIPAEVIRVSKDFHTGDITYWTKSSDGAGPVSEQRTFGLVPDTEEERLMQTAVAKVRRAMRDPKGKKAPESVIRSFITGSGGPEMTLKSSLRDILQCVNAF